MKPSAKRTNRTKQILIRLTPDEYAKTLAAAKATRLKLSAWFRMIALKSLERS